MKTMREVRGTRWSRVWLGCLLGCLLGGLPNASEAQSTRSRRDRDARETAPTGAGGGAVVLGEPAAREFAPVPAGHPLASMWNDPEFQRRLVGSYGFLSEAEPRMSPEEQAIYRDRVVPLLQEDPGKAVPVLEGLVRPEATAVFDFTLGTIQFQEGQVAQAMGNFEKALAKFPDYRRAQRSLAMALVREGQYAAAIPALTRALALGGGDSRIYGMLGFALLNEGRWVSAAGAYQQAVAQEPDNLDFRLGLVKATMGMSQWETAVAMLDELLVLHPDRDALWALQANVWIQQEQPAKAVVNLEVLRRMGRATSAHLGLLGDLYLMGDQRDLALGAYLEAMEGEESPVVGRWLRAAEILLSRGALEESRTLLERIKQKGGLEGDDRSKALKLEARQAMASGDAATGIRTLEELVRLNPLDGEALLLAGDHYARHGEPERAVFRFEAAAQLEGFEAESLLKQAQLKVQQQKYTEAVELLRRAQRIEPKDNVARYLERVEQVAARAR